MKDAGTLAALLVLRGDLDAMRCKIDALVAQHGDDELHKREDDPTALTLQQAAHETKHSEATLRRWAKDFGVGVKCGGRWAFDRSTIVDFARSRQGL